MDPEKIKQALDLMARAKKLVRRTGIPLADAFKLLLGRGDAGLAELAELEGLEVTQGEWLGKLAARMRDPSLIRGGGLDGMDIQAKGRGGKAGAAGDGVPRGLGTKLRPYQQQGLDWLRLLHRIGFGACLADDMGLGKTVQVLALLLGLKERDPRRPLNVLLVAPASLLFNWVREIERFTPVLRYRVAHPSAGGLEPPRKADLVLTTYGMVQRLGWLRERAWDLVVADEAQALKNPLAKQTRALKSLPFGRRIALTGTPIENRLMDLWSLFDFLNPGLLGSNREFVAFQKRLERDPEGYGRLRRGLSPYILRRLKTDRNLLPDLPDKVEMKAQATLTRKQVALYTRLSQRLAVALEGAGDFQRNGVVLGFLIKFKQICNHPDHFSGADGWVERDSGKFGLLREVCEPIRDKRERCLVFTQFAEIAGPLDLFLAGVFGKRGLVLTGRTPVAKRRDIVDAFQGDAWLPYLVLSVKAGGTGLNLTRASHVIHFDRWWNPAVEDQATDRAFRIGQSKNVLVHKFISRGTLEEKIDAMLEAKSSLAREAVGATGEEWIGRLGDGQLLELFSLSPWQE